MTTAKEIAAKITQVVEATMQGDLDVQGCGDQTKVLWQEARDLGLYQEVDAILQAQSDAEMEEATQETLKQLEILT